MPRLLPTVHSGRREPGTYVLTDFLVRSFERTVLAQLGLDRWPELRDDHFGQYRRAVWLTQRPTPRLSAQADAAAATLGLPLTVIHIGDAGLERQLATLLRPRHESDRTGPARQRTPGSEAPPQR